jgi:fructan beta-fructosidase
MLFGEFDSANYDLKTMKIQSVLTCLLISLPVFFSSCNTVSKEDAEKMELHYTEQHRPQFHFSPDSMWMNDPNGLVFYEGEYHLFYQHNPDGNVWGPMHWGHAISTDLVHWEHLPIALYPDSLGTIFSGSAVIDWKNSSGLGSKKHPPMVAIFTHHNHKLAKEGSMQFQYQSIAYSLDKGRSWTKYPGNPVLKNPGIRDFRDPKVIWYEEEAKWLMVFAAQDRILFYSSPDLIHWESESEFLVETAPGEGVWECPDFFPMKIGKDEKWVLIVSIGSGGPNGGSGTKYYVGEFDGHQFTNENSSKEARWIDFGKDNYAGVTWSDIPSRDGRRIFMGWMSNWQYANKVPTERWRNAMTLPRKLNLAQDEHGYILSSFPVSETEQLRAERIKLEPGPLRGRSKIGPAIEGGYPLYEIDLLIEYEPNKREGMEFGIILESTKHEQVVFGINTKNQKLFMSRMPNSGKTDFSENFPGMHVAPYQVSEDGEIRIQAFIDLSSIELFVDQGALVMTELFFPETGFDSILLYSSHESTMLKKGTIYSLKGAW